MAAFRPLVPGINKDELRLVALESLSKPILVEVRTSVSKKPHRPVLVERCYPTLESRPEPLIRRARFAKAYSTNSG